MRNHSYSIIKSWAQFDRKIRFSGRKLLGSLDRFDNCILVAGCQRSGTTALSRLFTSSDAMVNFQFGHDDELDAAQILSGWTSYPTQGRLCFQTTYLNDSYPEYFEHKNYKLVWVLRNPYSVVYSMLNNWKIGALNRLFRHCGHKLLTEKEVRKYKALGVWSVSNLRKACLSYNAKISQTGVLKDKLGYSRIKVVDYDDLIKNKAQILPKIYDFLDLKFHESCLTKLHAESISKADKFSKKESSIIESDCVPYYMKSRKYLNED
jgi:hypothetical protein